MKLKNYLFILLTLVFGFSGYAQGTYDVTGNVKGAEDDMPIPGVNVIKVGTTSGTATDFDGNFKLNVTSGDVLEFSSVGYASKKVTITGQKTINVSLSEDTNTLDEVVVVGYGARKKSDVTGSVSSVKSEELNAFPVLDAAQAMQGRASGVVVQSNNGGEPGAPISIKIRGNTSINASSSPLIVVDGFVGATMPQAGDIASLEVLKDASATAIYGSQGANGVIMVTTKKGKEGRLNFEINSSLSIQSTANRLDLLNAEDFVTYQNQVVQNGYLSDLAADPATSAPSAYVGSGSDTDWQDLIYRTAVTQNHQFSFSGGSDKIGFYASIGYIDQEGVVVNSDYNRLSFLSNVNAQLTDKFKVGLNLASAFSKKQGISTDAAGGSSGSSGTDAVIANTMRFAPDVGVYNSDFPEYFTTNTVGDPIDNPYGVATAREDDSEIDNFRANMYFDYEILEGLNFKTTFGVSTKNTFRGIYTPRTLIMSSGATIADPENGAQGRGSQDVDVSKSLLTESFLTYKKEIGKGILTLLGGISYQKNTRRQTYTEGTNTAFDSFSYYGIRDESATLVWATSNIDFEERELQSQFARVNYDHNDKYLFTATIRRDQSSVFAENNKTAYFPSAAFGWKVSNEEFLADSNVISNLKLRASYGLTGNQAISPYQSLANYTTTFATVDGETITAFAVDRPENPDLKWETSYQTNLGFDLGLLTNKISLGADFYNIDTKDLLMVNQTIPTTAGFSSDEILANAGEINNRGFDLSLNTRNVSTDNFNWTTDVVFSKNKSEVVALIGDADFFNENGVPNYYDSTDASILRVGEEIAQFWGYEYAGVYQGGDLPEGTITAGANPLAGDPLFYEGEDEDGNTNGQLGSEDRTIIGNPNPDFTWGITNNFSYKNWDMSVFFQGAQGGEIFNLTQSQLNNGDANTTYDYFNNAWTATNTNTDQPRVGNNSGREISSRFVEDGSYARLKNIAIAYNLPSDMLSNVGIQSLRLSLSAQNLLTFTSYSGLDPEVNFTGGSNDNADGNTVIGFDFGNYPTIQSVTFGVNIKF